MPIGWNIGVYRQRNDGQAPATFGSQAGPRLAVWQTGLCGLDWIEELVKQNKAISLGGTGYPLEFTAIAENIIPMILNGEPPNAYPVWIFDYGDIILPGWLGKTTKDQSVMNECQPHEWLLIRAWDES